MPGKISRSAAVSAAFLALAPSAAFASNLSGGNGQTLGFVKPMANLANGFELVGLSIVIISLVVLIAQHMLHREDLPGLAKICVSSIVGGAVILAAGSFLAQAGVTTTAALIR